jgi:hypothetical protein
VRTHDELQALAEAATPGPWHWDYSQEETAYETINPDGSRLIEPRAVDTEVPSGDFAREYFAGGVSMRGEPGTANSETFPDLPNFVIHTTDDIKPADAAYIAAMSPDVALALYAQLAEQRSINAARESAMFDAMRAADSRTRDLWEALDELVALANQPGYDDAEWESALGRAADVLKSPLTLTIDLSALSPEQPEVTE